MNSAQSAKQAIEWIEQQLTDLAEIRNATPRDPSFKNWRQATLTVMQRIWPSDHARLERFRRIPFSPADPHANARILREWYSKGCMEATKVLNAFIADIGKNGVPEATEIAASEPASLDVDVDFPTVDLPSGDLGSKPEAEDVPDNMFADLEVTPNLEPEPAPIEPVLPPIEEHLPVAPTPDPPQGKKGLNMKARLRDLLGFANLSTKAGTGNARGPAPVVPPPPPEPQGLDMIPVGDELIADASPAPLPEPELATPTFEESLPAAEVHEEPPAPEPPPVVVAPPVPAPPPPPVAQDPPAPETHTPRPEAGMSVVMSRPTTLRGSIEKVSIESLISPEFRSPSAEEKRAQEHKAEEPQAEESLDDEPQIEELSVEELLAAQPRVEEPPIEEIPATAVTPASIGRPVPTKRVAPPEAAAAPSPPAMPREKVSKVVPLPARAASRPPPPEPLDADVPDMRDEAVRGETDSEAVAKATEDFMRDSPVLGATGHRVKRGYDAPTPTSSGYEDPDALAVASIVGELEALGVPTARRAELRARLLDLARRLEKGALDWASLRKAVWFAMEHPEVARRLMPVLLPWMDRAA